MSTIRKYRIKYTKEILENVVKESKSFSDVTRKLGYALAEGNTVTFISTKIKSYGIDISHFVGKSYNKGRIINCKDWHDVLIKGKNRRENTKRLRRAMINSGMEYKCTQCELKDMWNNKKLILEIDHINQIGNDNRKENLQFLCPNCHSQKPIIRKPK